MFDGGGDDRVVGVEVAVREMVAHAGDVRPRHFGFRGGEHVGESLAVVPRSAIASCATRSATAGSSPAAGTTSTGRSRISFRSLETDQPDRADTVSEIDEDVDVARLGVITAGATAEHAHIRRSPSSRQRAAGHGGPKRPTCSERLGRGPCRFRPETVGGTGGIRTPEACARPLSRRLHSSTLPPFRSRGYRATLRGSQGEVPERPNGAPC